jgi:cell division protein FtsQ
MKQPQLQSGVKQFAWIIAGILGVISVVSAVNKKQRTYSANRIEVEIEDVFAADSNLITKDEVRELLQESFTYGITDNALKEIDVQRAERVLERNLFVKNADVFIDRTNLVHARIQQRQPVVRIIDGENRSYYLDREGNYMPLSDHYTPRVLVLTGFIKPYEANFMQNERHHLNDLFTLVQRLQKDEFFDRLIEQVHVSQNSDILLIPKLGKQQILFGRYLDAENAEQKLQRLKIFYKEALPREGWTKYELIDIRFENQVVCRK